MNLNSRFESHTKIVNRQIVIDGNTREPLDSSIAVEALGEELFKGKTIPVQVCSVRTP